MMSSLNFIKRLNASGRFIFYFLTLFLILIGIQNQNSVVKADEQECVYAAPICGGPDDPKTCYPTIRGLSATAIAVETTSTSPLTRILTLCVTVSAKGWHENHTTGPFKFSVHSGVDGSSEPTRTYWAQDVLPYLAKNVCVSMMVTVF